MLNSSVVHTESSKILEVLKSRKMTGFLAARPLAAPIVIFNLVAQGSDVFPTIT